MLYHVGPAADEGRELALYVVRPPELLTRLLRLESFRPNFGGFRWFIRCPVEGCPKRALRVFFDGHRGRYDLVSMNHLIEHVFDPLLLVERAFQLLRPGGYVLGQLPCLDGWERRIFGHNWGGYHFPRHLQGLSRNGLEHVLRSAGFEDIRITSALHLQTALSLQNTLVHVGWKPKMRHGKCPLYSFLLLAAAPFEVAAWVAGRTGVINFHARKPESRE